MSRCFPYPPPGYSRNGATYEALIESIKLQKETDKAKAERKKEKRARKERKKEKERRKDEGKGKTQKNPVECQPDAHKLLQSSVDFKEADFKESHDKRREPSVEQLEKSDLTEEHGEPICSHQPSYSSDSTQNSNKRKREDDAIFPGGTGGHGKPIKIRLLNKHKGPDSSKENASSNSGRIDPPNVSGADARTNAGTFSASGKTCLSVPSASISVPGFHSKEGTSAQGIFLNQQKSTPGFGGPGTKNNDVQGPHFGRKQSTPSSVRPAMPSVLLKHGIRSSNSNDTELPPSSGSKKSDLKGLHSSRQDSGRLALSPSHGNSHPTELEKKRKGSISEVPVGAVNNIQNLGLTRSEKKIKKQHAEYEKLIRTWIPPVLQAQLPGGDDDNDWLSSSDKMSKSPRNEVERCHEAASSSLWRPCAQFLTEADIYALPYTVPF